MKLKDIYKIAIRIGMQNDIRDDLDEIINRKKNDFEKLKDEEKKYFDLESIDNPYDDTRILYGSGDEEINGIFCGIDIEVAEIMLADRLKEKGKCIDLLLAHHPQGVARIGLHEVMHIQEDLLELAGIPINIAESIMTSRIAEVERTMMPANHQRTVDAARLMEIPFMCIHTPADNMVQNYLNKTLNQDITKRTNLGDIIEKIYEIPEYDIARKIKAGPKILIGDKKRRAGKLFVKMTGGTSGSEKAYENLAQAGVGTIICMHMTESHRKVAQENNLNVIIAGHMASDSLGLNLILDELEKEKVEIHSVAGLIRVSRNNI